MSPITPRNIIRHELIGLETKIVNSSNRSLIGISGKVIDESQNILFISHKNQSKAVPKTSSIFQFKLPNGFIVEVNGKQIAGRPEDRVKKAVRRRW